MKKLFLLFLLLASVPSFAQTTVAPFLSSKIQLLDNSGVVCAGCLLDTFSAGTTTPLVTYSESTGTTPNANPIVLDSAGRATVYLTSASYKFRLRSALGATLWTQDVIGWSTPLSTFAGITNTGNDTMQQSTAATAGANQSSNVIKVQGNYWTGAVSAVDEWDIQNVLGTGANPTSSLTITHSGSSGTSAVNLPSGLDLTFVRDRVGNPATSGFVRLQSSGAVAWRNNANGADILLQKTGVLSGAIPADSLDATGFGGVEGKQMIGTNISGQSNSAVLASGAGTIGFGWNNTTGAADQKWGDFTLSASTLLLRFVNDANSIGSPIMTVGRGALSAVGAITFGAGGGVQTLPTSTDTLVGKATTDTLSGKTLTGAASGNSVTLMTGCPPQDTLGAVTGNGTDQTIYTCTIPANTIQAGKGFRVRSNMLSNNAVAVTYKFQIDGVVIGTIPNGGTVETTQWNVEVFNNSGVQNAQTMMFTVISGTAILSNNTLTSAANFANAIIVKITANEAAANTVTPKKWFIELIQ